MVKKHNNILYNIYNNKYIKIILLFLIILLIKKDGYSKELVLNWNFVKSSLNPEISIDHNQLISQHTSLKIKGPGAASWFATVPVKQGHKYTISFFIKTKTPIQNNPNANFFAYITKKGGGGGLTVLFINDYAMKNYDEWTKITLGSYIPQEGVTDITLYLCLNGNRKDISHTDDSVIWFGDIKIVESDITNIKQVGNFIFNNPDITIWSVDQLSSIYKNDPSPGRSSIIEKIIISGAKGEKEGFQLVLNPRMKWHKVTWEWSDFSGPDKIIKEKMKNYLVEYINLPEQDNGLKKYLRGGRVPDPLPQEKISELPGNENSVFYFLIEIPHNIKAGSYVTTIKLKNDDKTIINIPVEIKVRKFSLPARPSFDMVSELYTHFIPFYEKGDQKEILTRYLKNLADHRTTTSTALQVSSATIDKIGPAKIKIDSDDFMKMLAYQKAIGWCHNLHLHWSILKILDGQYFINREIKIFLDENNSQINPIFKQYFTEYINKLINLMKKQNCFSNPRIKIADEPNISDPKQVNFYKNIAKLIKQINPTLEPESAGSFSLEFLPYYNQWHFPTSLAQFYQKEMNLSGGKNLKQLYANNMVSASFTPLRMRLFFWGLFKERYKGLLWWQINGWGFYKRIKDSSGKVIRQFEKGDPWKDDLTKKPGVIFLYPPREGKNETGPINSIRWEAMRKGLEDYEYLVMLTNLIKEKEGVVDNNIILKAKKVLKRVDEIVDHLPLVPGGSALNDHFHTYDVNLVEEVRTEIAEAIASLIGHET
jgi:hypothetical protein